MRPFHGRHEASNVLSGAGDRDHEHPTAAASSCSEFLVQRVTRVGSMTLFSNLLRDHDLITTAHDKRDALCARDLLITTTITWSIAHNLST